MRKKARKAGRETQTGGKSRIGVASPLLSMDLYTWSQNISDFQHHNAGLHTFPAEQAYKMKYILWDIIA